MSEYISKTKNETLINIIQILCTGEDARAQIQEFAEQNEPLSHEELSASLDILSQKGIEFKNNSKVIQFYEEVIENKLAASEMQKHPAGHPVRVYMEENCLLRSLLTEISKTAPRTAPAEFTELFSELSKVEIHFLRKENQLFPLLEKHGWNGPSTNMWAIHDNIRVMMKEIREGLKEQNLEIVANTWGPLESELRRLISIEEARLLPNALQLLEESEWENMRTGDEEIGWMLKEEPTPYPPRPTEEEYIHPSQLKIPTDLPFSTESKFHYDEGYMTPEQVNLIFRHLPFDITYVDENDRVVFYNRGDDRVFPRSAGIIGREVRLCHPPKSVDMVLRILEEFKKGNKDTADFRINFKDRYIQIRYFAVRDPEKNYRGVLEMSQDITDIQKLEGEQRLLDWA